MTVFLDNVVAIATFIEITKGIAHVTGWDPFVFYWALLFSGAMAGNYTPIGSTVNIVALGILEQNKEKFSFSYCVKKAFVVTTLQLLVSIVWLIFLVHR
jgi:Na+/H+ antiporter NhaD/arsenite permease-like protein